MRSLLQTVINSLLSAEADAVCSAKYGQASPERRVQRNGYRHRDLDTRVGTIDVAVPKLRTGSYFPDWLLERRKRAESALITVDADAYLAGVSTRHMDKLIGTLGISLNRSGFDGGSDDTEGSLSWDRRSTPMSCASEPRGWLWTRWLTRRGPRARSAGSPTSWVSTPRLCAPGSRRPKSMVV